MSNPLIHPLVNFDDFPEGVVMNNTCTTALGFDLLADPGRKNYMRKSVIQGDGLYMIGPVLPVLRECQISSEEEKEENTGSDIDFVVKSICMFMFTVECAFYRSVAGKIKS